MEKENKEKEKSSAQKEKASRGRVAPDNFFIPSKKNARVGVSHPLTIIF